MTEASSFSSPSPTSRPGEQDFEIWRAYYNQKHPTAQLADAMAWEIYNSYYPCACERCLGRRSSGYHPFKVAGAPGGCTAPDAAIDQNYVRGYVVVKS